MYAGNYESEVELTFTKRTKLLYETFVGLRAYPPTAKGQVEVRQEVPSQRKQKSRARKAKGSGVRVHKRVLRRTCR